MLSSVKRPLRFTYNRLCHNILNNVNTERKMRTLYKRVISHGATTFVLRSRRFFLFEVKLMRLATRLR